MTQNEIKRLVDQFLQKNRITEIPQSTIPKHNIPTFGNHQKGKGRMSVPILLNGNFNLYYKGNR